jgi:hypothetical protein
LLLLRQEILLNLQLLELHGIPPFLLLQCLHLLLQYLSLIAVRMLLLPLLLLPLLLLP